jgi:hypothetical protein
VTPARKNARYRVIERRAVNKSLALRADQSIKLIGNKSKIEVLPILRRIIYVDPESRE